MQSNNTIISKKMRILTILFYYHPKFSGAAIQFHRLARQFIRLGHDVIVVTPQHKDLAKLEYLDKVFIKRVLVFGAKRWLEQFSFMLSSTLALIKFRNHYDLVHIHSLGIFDLLPIFCARILGKPTVFQRTIKSIPPVRWKSKLCQLLTTPGWYGLSGYVAVSSPLLKEKNFKAMMHKPVQVLTRGVDLKTFYPINSKEKLALRKDLDLDPEATYIAFVGSIVPRKGVDVLVRAFVLLSQTVEQSISLLLIGKNDFQSGDFMNSQEESARQFYQLLKNELEAANLIDQVVFTGVTSRVPDYLRIADIFVFPSKREGIPNAVLEAMGSGLPCIVSELDGIVYDMIKHDLNGIVVSDDDPKQYALAIQCLLSDPSRAQALGKAARQKIEERFSLVGVAREYIDYYQNLVNLNEKTPKNVNENRK